MSYYIDRYVKWGEETTWATAVTPSTFSNYLLHFEGGWTDNRVDEPVIAGQRDAKSRTYVHREVAAVMRVQPVSARWFEFCLGSVATAAGGSLPATITPGTVLPSITAERVYRPVPGSENNALKLWGLKVDTWELTIEQQEDIVLEMNFAGHDATLETVSYSPPEIDYTVPAAAFHNASLKYNGDKIRFRRLVISGDNNLEARFESGGTIGNTFCCQELREGGCEISGRLQLDTSLSTYAAHVLSRSEGTLECSIQTSAATIVITLNNVAFEEYREPITGLDVIEVEIPFSCRRVDEDTPAIEIVQKGSGSWASLKY